MQIIVECTGGIKEYAARGPDCVAPLESLSCPFCRPRHRLRRHGSYCRNAVTESSVHRVAIARFLCPATGRTVSLLPDFLVPRKQHTAAVIASFLHAFAWLGLSLAIAVRIATRVYPSHEKGRFWARAVASRASVVRRYITAQHVRVGPPGADWVLPAEPPRILLRALLGTLSAGWPDLPSAFVYHSRRLHARYRLALA